MGEPAARGLLLGTIDIGLLTLPRYLVSGLTLNWVPVQAGEVANPKEVKGLHVGLTVHTTPKPKELGCKIHLSVHFAVV